MTASQQPGLSPLATTDRLFFGREDAALDRATAERIVADALSGCDDGELFLEYRESEHISLEDGRIRHAGFETSSGFGLRAILGEETGYAHAGEISEPRCAAPPPRSPPCGRRQGRIARNRRAPATPGSTPTATRSATWISAPAPRLLAEIDAYARAKDPRVKQVMASMYRRVAGRADHARRRPPRRRPAPAGAAERRRGGGAGRPPRDRQPRHRRPLRLQPLADPETWRAARGRGAAPGPGQPGQPPGPGRRDGGGARPGWPGILLHEAIGHGLEGDFNRKKTSAFAGLMGQRIASHGRHRGG